MRNQTLDERDHMTDAGSADIEWRLGDEAAAILQRESAATNPTALGERLRKGLAPARAAWLAQQIELRRRAQAKFGAAFRMYFTPRGLEQATDETTAAYKAKRFAAGQPVADLCCGVGGDLMALAGRASTAHGVDLDPWTAAVALANCRAVGAKQVVTFPTLVALEHVTNVAAWHCDPDRRVSERRSTQPDQFSPTWSEVERLLQANPNAAIKLAPASSLSEEWSEQGEREWISYRGECRQQTLWLGALTDAAGQRRATALSRNGAMQSLVGTSSERLDVAQRIDRYIIDPDASLLAAKLAGAACRAWNARACDRDGAYLTSDAVYSGDDAVGTWFEVDDVLPLDVKKLRAYLRERNIGRLELKTRGADVKLEELSRRLALSKEGEAATLIAARTLDGVRAVVCRRVSEAASSGH